MAMKGQATTATMDERQVREAYRRWAPTYDRTFGWIANAGRRHAVELINQRTGSVLEVGVGTGLSLPMLARHLQVYGIDLSPHMLERARQRVRELGLTNVKSLQEIDATSTPFADATFDTVVAMYVMTVVPEPERVMIELARVVKPGGAVILVNHFSQDEGVRGWIERRLAPFGAKLGWRPVFDQSRVLGVPGLALVERRALRPLGLFTMLRFEKTTDAAVPAPSSPIPTTASRVA
jgi:phosphatidylethanolamine/phosphatidyl-N-methylethanolamine N-methyltransferase